jgi:hypothetical protein
MVKIDGKKKANTAQNRIVLLPRHVRPLGQLATKTRGTHRTKHLTIRYSCQVTEQQGPRKTLSALYDRKLIFEEEYDRRRAVTLIRSANVEVLS